MAIFTVMATLCIIFTYAQCNPPRALWEPVPGAKCWNPDSQANFSIATTGENISRHIDCRRTCPLTSDIAFGALFDYELSLFPLIILWGLKMPLKRKIGLYVLLSFSVL